MEEGKTAKIVLEHAEEIQDACKRYPAITEQIENFQKEMRRLMKQTQQEIKDICDQNDQEVVTFLVINNIHKLTDDIFLT